MSEPNKVYVIDPVDPKSNVNVTSSSRDNDGELPGYLKSSGEEERSGFVLPAPCVEVGDPVQSSAPGGNVRIEARGVPVDGSRRWGPAVLHANTRYRSVVRSCDARHDFHVGTG